MGISRSLFKNLSRNLEFLLNRYQIDWSLGEFVLIRRLALDTLNCADITQETYNYNEHFLLTMEACYIHMNNIYDTNHSFSDVREYR